MLVRAFRITDRLGNAFLRIAAWITMVLVEQTAYLKRALFGGTSAAVGSVVSAASHAAQRTSQTARQAYEVTAERRQQTMVQRAAEAELKPAIREDPLRAQNRALSAFAVLLLIALLAIVVLQTQDDDDQPFVSGGGSWPESRGTEQPTAIFPTAIPTASPVPDPLRVGGSIVFALRENGQTDLWAISVGQSTPLRLTNSPADDRDPTWSADGTLAFASHRDGNWELYIMQIDTGAITRLTYTPGFEAGPSWSPDGAYIVYEGYNENTKNLDLYIISSDPGRAAAEGAIPVTYSPAPDFEPVWSPGGRQIAYVSARSGNQDIYIIDLDNRGDRENEAINLTNTPDIHEDYPHWSPDGTRIAYSASVDGVEGVYMKPAQQPEAEPILIGRGRMPAWAPNGGSLVYTLDFGRQTQLLAGVPGSFGAATDATILPGRAADPDWTNVTLPNAFVVSGGVPADPAVTAGLYTENEHQQPDGLYGLALLNGVNTSQAYLSDRVNDSFEALRIRVLEQAGYDFLGTLEDAFWSMDRPPDLGEPSENWHYTGRAFAIDRNLIYAGEPSSIEVVKEDIEVNTYWRIYLRVVDEAQNGTLGEPLRRIPWDITARSSGDVEDYESGGHLKTEVPSGYYVDLTLLAEDFGWMRVSAARTWQRNFGAIQFWEFTKTDNLSWNEAMLELYPAADVQNFQSEATSIPAPPPLPTGSPTPEIERTATPIPPDQQ